MKTSFQKAFTLVELLIVMTIISVLVGLVGSGFRSSQIRGRDAQRKSDLRQIAAALELLYADYTVYPEDDGNGWLKACPYDPQGVTSTICTWGESQLNDGKTSYLRLMPSDPGTGLRYYYRTVASSDNQKFQLFAHLENTKDQDCIEGSCENPPPPNYNCGTKVCNFAITSSNTDYSE